MNTFMRSETNLSRCRQRLTWGMLETSRRYFRDCRGLCFRQWTRHVQSSREAAESAKRTSSVAAEAADHWAKASHWIRSVTPAPYENAARLSEDPYSESSGIQTMPNCTRVSCFKFRQRRADAILTIEGHSSASNYKARSFETGLFRSRNNSAALLFRTKQ
jgi:hypothetical protein